MIDKIIQWLDLPELKEIKNLDHHSTTELHRKIISSKSFLRKFYSDIYKQYKEIIDERSQGVFVELGSGGGFVNKVLPQIITSDILFLRDIDLCFNAECIPFKDNSVDVFFMINVFHHIKDSQNFLSELSRCLKPQGKVFMVEPANTMWSRFIYKNLHHEGFDLTSSWNIEGEGPLSCANGAMPWIVFVRDCKKFEGMFASLEILRLKPHTPFSYLISGGVSKRQLLPGFMYGFVKLIEWLLYPFNNLIGMFYTVELIKRD